jgi:hypothetical protein
MVFHTTRDKAMDKCMLSSNNQSQTFLNTHGVARPEVFMVVNIQVQVTWVVTLCSAVVGYQPFCRSTLPPPST